jgi:GntR family transcriptional regulator
MQRPAPKPQIVPPVPRWQQIADYLRHEILSGRYPAGQPLPSEEILAAEFEVSRPTIRQGIAQLVAEGLLSVHRPHGTIVHDPYARPTHNEQRTLRADPGGYHEPGAPQWVNKGQPIFTHTDATVAHAQLLDIAAGEPMLTRDALQHTADGQRRHARPFLPFSVAAQLATLRADDPHLPAPGEVYKWLAGHGHPPQFTEYVRTRMPRNNRVLVAAEPEPRRGSDRECDRYRPCRRRRTW